MAPGNCRRNLAPEEQAGGERGVGKSAPAGAADGLADRRRVRTRGPDRRSSAGANELGR